MSIRQQTREQHEYENENVMFQQLAHVCIQVECIEIV